MTRKQAITKAIENSSYIGSHRPEIFERELNKRGYKIVRKGRVLDNTQGER